MKCPILVAGEIVTKGTARWVGEINSECLMGQCAWWEERFGKCAIVVEAHLKGVEKATGLKMEKR